MIPKYRPSSYDSSFGQLVTALLSVQTEFSRSSQSEKLKVPFKTPPASAVKVTELLIAPKPANRPAVSTDQVQRDRPQAVERHQPTDQTPAVTHQNPGMYGAPPKQDIN